MMIDSASMSLDSNRGALAFYRALHRAMDATVHVNAPRPRLIDALLSLAFDSFRGNVVIQCEDEPPLACHRGCASCCTLRVSATAPEVFLIARFLRAVLPELHARDIDLLGKIRDIAARTRGLSESQRVSIRQFCPFIARGACVIYSVRPLACRGHASHDLKACVDAAAGRRTEVPYSNGHYMVRSLVQNAMQSSLRAAGFAWGVYELNHAVLLALDDPTAESTWLAGEDALQDAALNEVSAAEMAEVYDLLRPDPPPP